MKDRSELLSIFMGRSLKFLEVTMQRNISLQNFLPFCPHKESYINPHVHTPQQNGIAKRKNRHLIETA